MDLLERLAYKLGRAAPRRVKIALFIRLAGWLPSLVRYFALQNIMCRGGATVGAASRVRGRSGLPPKKRAFEPCGLFSSMETK